MEYLKNLEKEILLFEEATGIIPDIIIANTNDIKDILPSIEYIHDNTSITIHNKDMKNISIMGIKVYRTEDIESNKFIIR